MIRRCVQSEAKELDEVWMRLAGVIVPIICQADDCGRRFWLPIDRHGVYAFFFKPTEYTKYQMRIGRSEEDIEKEIEKAQCPICKEQTMVFIMKRESALKFRQLVSEAQFVPPSQMRLPGEEVTNVSPPGSPAPSRSDFIDIEAHYVSDKVYSQLIGEINTCYEYEAYSSALVMLRKLLENLIVDILRFKYAPAGQHDKYFDYTTNQFLPLNALISNFEQIVNEYAKYGLLKSHVAAIKGFRKEGNISAHSIVDFVSGEKLLAIKKRANESVIVLLRIIGIIRGILDEKGRIIKKK